MNIRYDATIHFGGDEELSDIVADYARHLSVRLKKLGFDNAAIKAINTDTITITGYREAEA